MAPTEIKGCLSNKEDDKKLQQFALQRSKEEEKKIHQALLDLNLQVALFRDLLLGVGSSKDSPELREKIRKVRMAAVEEVSKTNISLLPHIKNCISEGTIVDNGQLICLYLLARLLQRELEKCQRLVTSLPMQDMDKHFDDKSKKPATGGIGTMLTQIVMCSSARPDFNAEEVASVSKNQKELCNIVEDMADHLPIEDPNKAMNGLTCNDQDRRKWTLKRKRRKCSSLTLAQCCFCKS